MSLLSLRLNQIDVREAELLSKISNPYILEYYDSFIDGENFYIVTEYCDVCDMIKFLLISIVYHLNFLIIFFLLGW